MDACAPVITGVILRGKLYFWRWSGWQDLNLRSPVPKTGGIPNLPTPGYYVGVTNESRTQISLVHGQGL